MKKNALAKLPLLARSAITLGAAILFAILTSLACSALLLCTADPTAFASLLGNALFLCTMGFCGFLGAKTAKESRVASGLLPSGMLLLLAVAASLAFGESEFLRPCTVALLGAVCATGASLLGTREKRRKKR